MPISRRNFLGLTAAGALLPRQLLALSPEEAAKRKFLFIYCRGGWDTTYCFSPEFQNSLIDMESDATTGEEGGITFVDHDTRPSVRSFFERYGASTAVINGIEVRSIAHEKAQQLVFTGAASPGYDDWPSIIGHFGDSALQLPHVNVSGPTYTANYQGSVVRLGSAGQLSSLFSGASISEGTIPITLPPSAIQTLEDQFVLDRASNGARVFDSSYLSVLNHLNEFSSSPNQLDLEVSSTLEERIHTVLDCFEMGFSRCGIVQYDGHQDLGWDTHGGNEIQGWHYEELFGVLNGVMESLEERVGPAGQPLSEDVCVVVFSEMGRHPKINSHQGKDHWTFTSAMLCGSGVDGGRVVGGYDEEFYGKSIDLESGELFDGGSRLSDKHFGATLLALAGVDWEEYTGGMPPITGIIRP